MSIKGYFTRPNKTHEHMYTNVLSLATVPEFWGLEAREFIRT
jgi:hypothetical protein